MRPCIVVADDNESLRYLTMAAIESAPGSSDFDLEEASDASSALASVHRLAAGGARILLLSDNLMPRMSGADLAREVRARYHAGDVRIEVLTSAQPPDKLVSAMADVQTAVHQRPSDLKGLRKMVADIIADWQASVAH